MKFADYPTVDDDAFMKAMRVEIPEADFEGMRIIKFEVKDDLENWAYALEGRDSTPGWYTRLQEQVPDKPEKERTTAHVDRRNGYKWRIWMTDTEAERRDHLPVLRMAKFLDAERAIINGLGLGCVVKGLLSIDTIKHIDVVEIDERVIHLVGPTLDPDRVHIHHCDALVQMKRWPRNTHWDVAWHDIWPGGHPKFRPIMDKLMRSYARRVKWQGAWAHEVILGRG